jgi:hypothetical protein
MRLRVVVALSVAGVCISAPAFAVETKESLPDLPGMKLAKEAARGDIAPSQPTQQRETSNVTRPDAQVASETPAKPDASSINDMPGTDTIPVISDLASFMKRGREGTMPRGLTALAALGTILAVGGFLVLRDRLV